MYFRTGLTVIQSRNELSDPSELMVSWETQRPTFLYGPEGNSWPLVFSIAPALPGPSGSFPARTKEGKLLLTLFDPLQKNLKYRTSSYPQEFCDRNLIDMGRAQ